METNHREIIVLRGVPASGKSTYARELMAQGYKRVSRDCIRMMLNNYSLDNSDENDVTKIHNFAIANALKTGKNIVVDNTNTKTDDVAKIKHLVNRHAVYDDSGYDYKIIEMVFDLPVKDCIIRNKARQGLARVPDQVIKKMFANLQNSLENDVMVSDERRFSCD